MQHYGTEQMYNVARMQHKTSQPLQNARVLQKCNTTRAVAGALTYTLLYL